MWNKIALLGTGLMGAPMADRLLAAGMPLTVWNRTPQKANALLARGAQWAVSPAEAVSGAQVVVTMLADGPAVREVLTNGGVARAMEAGALFVDMSSIPPEMAREHAKILTSRTVEALDAPVSGGVVGAENGTLAIMAGGTPEAFHRAQPLFVALGKATHVGPAGSGALAKLANQMIVGVTIGAVAEALLLMAAGGADPAAVRDAIRGGFAESRVLELHGARMLERNFVPGGRSATQLKDLESALNTAALVGVELPLTLRSTQLYRDFVRQGGGDLDHSALLLALEKTNPLAEH